MPPLTLIAAAAVFVAVFVVAFSLQSLVVERRQAYRTLQTLRAVEVRPTDLRNRELARPARERLLRPFYNAAISLGRRFTPAGARDAISRKLVMAGSPASWDADSVLACKVGGFASGAAAGSLVLFGLGLPLVVRVIVFLALCLGGYYGPNIVLANAVQRRQAGIGFDAALAHVSKNTTGPLAEELYRTLQEVQLGRSRKEAMRNLAARSNVPELSAFVLAMVQADIFGVSVASVLRIQAGEMRVKRRQLAA